MATGSDTAAGSSWEQVDLLNFAGLAEPPVVAEPECVPEPEPVAVAAPVAEVMVQAVAEAERASGPEVEPEPVPEVLSQSEALPQPVPVPAAVQVPDELPQPEPVPAPEAQPVVLVSPQAQSQALVPSRPDPVAEPEPPAPAGSPRCLLILDTETTGLEISAGNRIIEIGCIELVSRRPTGKHFHRYLNPERDIEEGALAVHGITRARLEREPTFAVIAAEFLEFVAGAELVIHNAPFDLGFLNHEFQRIGMPPFVEHCTNVIDTLVQAKELHPGKRNSLDALCDRYGISNAHRKLHGALLDSELLADVYLAMTRGQNSLSMDVEPEETGAGVLLDAVPLGEIIVVQASGDELAAHEAGNRLVDVARDFTHVLAMANRHPAIDDFDLRSKLDELSFVRKRDVTAR